MEERECEGNCCLFVFARVCKGWRKAQLKVGAPLRTRVASNVVPTGNALAKWALAEGRPRDDGGNEDPFTLAHAAAEQGHLELVVSRIGEGGFALNKWVMEFAAKGTTTSSWCSGPLPVAAGRV